MKKILTILNAVVLLLYFSGICLSSEVHEAAKSGDVTKLRQILDKNPSLLTSKDEVGKTPLHWAVGRGQLKIVEVLLKDYKIDPNIKNENEGTPLHVAASQAQPEAALILIQHGADVNARTLNNSTPLHFACFKGQKQGHIDAAKILIENGADVNAATDQGMTALSMAMQRGNSEIIKILQSKGAKKGILHRSRNRGTAANPYFTKYKYGSE